MSRNQVARREGGRQGNLASHDGGGKDASELPGVVARVCARALDSQHLEARGLGSKTGAAAHGADLQGRHGDRDVQVLAIVDLVHQHNARRALHILRWVLARSEEARRHNVGGVRVEAAHRARHGTAHQVLGHVQLRHSIHVRLENVPHNVALQHRLSDNRLAASVDPNGVGDE